MSQDEFNSFDDFIKICREYMNSNDSRDNTEDSESNSENNDCENCRFGNKNADASEGARKACSDIPGGFQDINPQLFTIVTTIIGTIAAGNLPFNIQNAIGNWLELLGQSIITFNAQQQYYQGGPGRIYNPIYRNAANPFCSEATDESQANVSTSKKKSSKTKSNINSKESYKDDLEELKSEIIELNKEIKKLKKEMEELKKR